MKALNLKLIQTRAYIDTKQNKWIYLGSIDHLMLFMNFDSMKESYLNETPPVVMKISTDRAAMDMFPELLEQSTDPNDFDIPDPCPDCGEQLRAGKGGGEVCIKPGCGYWFCY